MIIYCITNLVNGKKYVGQTRTQLERRWSSHKKSSRQPSGQKHAPVLYKAISKYGIDNFKIEEIDKADNQEHLNDLEEIWIAKLGTTDRKRGYNISWGGASSPTSESRAKLSAALKGKPAWNKGKPLSSSHYQNIQASGIWANKGPLSEETKRKIGDGRRGENNPNYLGKSVTESTRQKMRDRMSGKNHFGFREDLSLESMKQLRSLGFTYKKISEVVGCCKYTVMKRLGSWPEEEAA